jgi:hypothetical protein
MALRRVDLDLTEEGGDLRAVTAHAAPGREPALQAPSAVPTIRFSLLISQRSVGSRQLRVGTAPTGKASDSSDTATVQQSAIYGQLS